MYWPGDRIYGWRSSYDKVIIYKRIKYHKTYVCLCVMMIKIYNIYDDDVVCVVALHHTRCSA